MKRSAPEEQNIGSVDFDVRFQRYYSVQQLREPLKGCHVGLLGLALAPERENAASPAVASSRMPWRSRYVETLQSTSSVSADSIV